MGKKILFVIDSLNSGGAQRQLIYLARGFKNKGYEPHIFVYHPEYSFFLKDIIDAGIVYHKFESKGGFSFSILRSLFLLVKKNKFKTIISFLEAPNFYCEVLKILTFFKIKIIISERNFYADPRNRFNNLKTFFHVFADKIVANSHTQADWLKKRKWLKKKVYVIYNGYPLKKINTDKINFSTNHKLKLLVIGRVDSGKNGLKLLEALIYHYNIKGDVPIISWAGRVDNDPDSISTKKNMDSIILANPIIFQNWIWLGERKDIDNLILEHDAIIHVSLYEGLPNAICEAMLLARPVIASDICDNSHLIINGFNGFLCSKDSDVSISNAIDLLESQSNDERKRMGVNAFNFAQEILGEDKMIDKFIDLL